MKVLRFVATEVWQELRAACRGPLIPVVVVGLVAYMLLTLANAEIVRSFGQTDRWTPLQKRTGVLAMNPAGQPACG